MNVQHKFRKYKKSLYIRLSPENVGVVTQYLIEKGVDVKATAGTLFFNDKTANEGDYIIFFPNNTQEVFKKLSDREELKMAETIFLRDFIKQRTEGLK